MNLLGTVMPLLIAVVGLLPLRTGPAHCWGDGLLAAGCENGVLPVLYVVAVVVKDAVVNCLLPSTGCA